MLAPLGDEESFLGKSLELAKDTPLQKRLGESAAAYAAKNLDWIPVVGKFEYPLSKYAKRKEANPIRI